jgi:hypothetical protein
LSGIQTSKIKIKIKIKIMYVLENKLEFIGSDEQVREVREFIKEDIEDGAYIDFEKIMPIPEELEYLGDSLGGLVHSLLFGYIPGFHYDEEEEEDYGNEDSDYGDKKFDYQEYQQNKFKKLSESQKREGFEKALKYQSNLEKFGGLDLYHWCINNWGTYLDAFNQYLISENKIGFLTRDYSAQKLIIKLSEIFPQVIFNLEIIDPEEQFHSMKNRGFYDISCYSTIKGAENHCYRRDYGNKKLETSLS